MTTKTILFAAAILAATSAGALAYTPRHADIESRLQRQLAEIERGRQNGTITWTEGIKLRAEQRRIAAYEESLEADGKLTVSERRELTALQNGAHQDIEAKKNNGWSRVWWLPRFGY